MWPHKRKRKKLDFNYPHKFNVGDLVTPQLPIQTGIFYVKNEMGTITKLYRNKDGKDMVEILLQTSSSVVTMSLARFLHCYEKV